MEDPGSAACAIQAIRASETLYKAGDKSFAADYKRLTQDAEPRRGHPGDADDEQAEGAGRARRRSSRDRGGEQGARRPAGRRRPLLNPAAANAGRGGPSGRGGRVYTPEQQGVIDKGGQIYKELCFACHGDDGLRRAAAG